MERFEVKRTETVYNVREMNGSTALTKGPSIVMPVAEPCTLKFLDVPLTLPTAPAPGQTVIVTVTVTSDTGCKHLESARVSASSPEWVSLGLDFEEKFTIESEATVKIEGSSDGKVQPICILVGPTQDGRRVVMTAKALVERVFTLETTPKIVVAMPVYGAEPKHLEEALDSLEAQTYPHWELRAFLDGAEDQDDLWDVLQKAQGYRVTVVGRGGERIGIARATNRCLEGAAWDGSEIVAFMDCDDLLHPDALVHVAKAFSDKPRTKLVYTDEDKVDEWGHRSEAHFKPDFNREMLYSQNYPCHLTAARAAVVAAHMLRTEYDGAQDHDFWLRATAKVSDCDVVHIPEILYHWRKTATSTASNPGAKDGAWTAGMKAVWSALRDEYGDSASVMKGSFPGIYRYQIELPAPASGDHDAARVGIVVPTKNNLEYLEPCLKSIASTIYPGDVTTIIVDNGSDPGVSEKMRLLASECERSPHDGSRRFEVWHDDRPFNWSALSNRGCSRLRGCDDRWKADVLVFMNDDIEARDPYWLRELVQALCFKGVAVAGPKLLYPNGSIQHAGVVIGMGGIAGHAHKRADDRLPTYFCRPHIMQRVSAVTGACMAVWRKDFESVGMFDEGYPTAFNDIDFCLKIGRAGMKVVYTPWSVLTHHESVSRGPDTDKPEFVEAVRRMELTWGCSKYGDPYFNKNLDLHSERFVPRVPWIG